MMRGIGGAIGNVGRITRPGSEKPSIFQVSVFSLGDGDWHGIVVVYLMVDPPVKKSRASLAFRASTEHRQG